MECKQRKQGILDTVEQEKNPVAFSQIHSHQEGILIDKTESDKGDPMHLTNRNKGKKSEQAARAPRNA